MKVYPDLSGGCVKSYLIIKKLHKKGEYKYSPFEKFLVGKKLSRFDHLTVFQTRGTNADPFNSAVNVSLYPLQIRQPSPSARIVSMTHLVPVQGTFTAYITNS